MASTWANATTSALGQTIGQGITPTSTAPNANQVQLTQAYLTQLRADLDRDYELKKQQSDQQYKTAMAGAKNDRERNEITKWYNEKQVSLAQDRLAQEDKHFGLTFGENQRQFNATFGENQRQFDTTTGYGLLKTLSELRGPADYFQAANYSRGVANDPNSAAFLKALQSNTRMADYGAQQGVPQAETGSTLLAKLNGTYQAGTGGTGNASGGSNVFGASGGGSGGLFNNSASSGTASRQSQASGIYAAGAHKIGGGVLEGLSSTELALLKSGIEAEGGDWNSFLEGHARSRVGQGIGMNRAA